MNKVDQLTKNEMTAPPPKTATMKTDLIIARIMDYFTQKSCGILSLYLMESATNGNLRKDSDIDIAILVAPPSGFSLLKRLEVAADLELLLGRTVDIGVVSPDNLVYSSEAILKGIRCDIADKDIIDMQETRILGCYIQFRRDRQEVEEACRAA